jgi:hypothetical protein
MVDQADVKPTNGHTELPPQTVARSGAEFLHDLTILAELQGKLLLVDFRQGLWKLLMPFALLLVGASVALGSVPIALAALALTLVETTTLTLAQSLGVSLLVGVLVSGVLTLAGWAGLRSNLGFLNRSYAEWRRNLQWAKDTLKRLGQAPRSPAQRGSPAAGHN